MGRKGIAKEQSRISYNEQLFYYVIIIINFLERISELNNNFYLSKKVSHKVSKSANMSEVARDGQPLFFFLLASFQRFGRVSSHYFSFTSYTCYPNTSILLSADKDLTFNGCFITPIKKKFPLSHQNSYLVQFSSSLVVTRLGDE